jgi:hypothetical protein
MNIWNQLRYRTESACMLLKCCKRNSHRYSLFRPVQECSALLTPFWGNWFYCSYPRHFHPPQSYLSQNLRFSHNLYIFFSRFLFEKLGWFHLVDIWIWGWSSPTQNNDPCSTHILFFIITFNVMFCSKHWLNIHHINVVNSINVAPIPLVLSGYPWSVPQWNMHNSASESYLLGFGQNVKIYQISAQEVDCLQCAAHAQLCP